MVIEKNEAEKKDNERWEGCTCLQWKGWNHHYAISPDQGVVIVFRGSSISMGSTSAASTKHK
jgi:hypothetical protein